MANNPQQATDEALAALREAGEQAAPDQPGISAETIAPASDVAPVPPPADLFPETPPTSRLADEMAPRRAANDGRPTVGEILHTLSRPTHRTPYILAASASAVWVI